MQVLTWKERILIKSNYFSSREDILNDFTTYNKKYCGDKNNILFIDASKECVKVTNNNKLTNENIDNIVKIFTDRKDIDYVAKLVSNSEIEENDYNLSVSTYVEKEDTREKIDIVELNKQIEKIVAREQVLRDEIDNIVKEIDEKNG